MSDRLSAGLIVVKEGVAIQAKQEIPYFVGISANTVGAQGISMQRIVFPPGSAAKPHVHLDYETAIYIVQGQVETHYGPGLRETIINEPGDFVYIPAGVPHLPRNPSQTETAIAIVARNDAQEQERVVPYEPEQASE
jgi:uncharacterized RmlC-like cupin family protein